jgi:hypothetical protein
VANASLHFAGGNLKRTLIWLMIGLVYTAGAISLFGAFHHAGFKVIAIITFVYLSLLMVTVAVMMDYPPLPRQPRMNEIADELEQRRLLISGNFSADRAFRVDECNGEGPHYFLELEDGGILHLSGNYLYDYEPGEGSPRHFPCTRFTVRRHADLGHVVDIVCGGLIIEPEVEAPPYTAWDFSHGNVPRDGQIVRSLTFDQLRQQRIAPRYRMQ